MGLELAILVTSDKVAELLARPLPGRIVDDDQCAWYEDQRAEVIRVRREVQEDRDAKELVHRKALKQIQQECDPVVRALRDREAAMRRIVQIYNGGKYPIPPPMEVRVNGGWFSRLKEVLLPWHSQSR